MTGDVEQQQIRQLALEEEALYPLLYLLDVTVYRLAHGKATYRGIGEDRA